MKYFEDPEKSNWTPSCVTSEEDIDSRILTRNVTFFQNLTEKT